MKSILLTGMLLSALLPVPMQASPLDTDPPPDTANPASMVEITEPSHDVQLLGVLYTAAGARPHATCHMPHAIIYHGFPGYAQNLDLAQVLRRAGYNVLAVHYRGRSQHIEIQTDHPFSDHRIALEQDILTWLEQRAHTDMNKNQFSRPFNPRIVIDDVAREVMAARVEHAISKKRGVRGVGDRWGREGTFPVPAAARPNPRSGRPHRGPAGNEHRHAQVPPVQRRCERLVEITGSRGGKGPYHRFHAYQAA